MEEIKWTLLDGEHFIVYDGWGEVDVKRCEDYDTIGSYMIHSYKKIEHSIPSSLRLPVRILLISIWSFCYVIFLIPLFSIILYQLTSLISFFYENASTQSNITTFTEIFALIILFSLLIIGIFLLIVATRRIPKYVKPLRNYIIFLFSILQKLFRNRKVTVMLIPHSEKRILNFRLSTYSSVFLIIFSSVIFIGAFYAIVYFPLKKSQNDLILFSLEKRIESERNKLEQLEKEKVEIEKILLIDRDIIQTAYSYHFRLVKQIILHNNFIVGFFIGFFSSLLATIVYRMFTNYIIRKDKNNSNSN